MSDTPRSDKIAALFDHWESVGLCRTLERELGVANTYVASMREEIGRLILDRKNAEARVRHELIPMIEGLKRRLEEVERGIRDKTKGEK